MTMVEKILSRMGKRALSGVVAGVLSLGAVPAQTRSQDAPPKRNEEKPTVTTQGKFYCNSKALNPAERAAHKQLTDKLIAERKEIVEMERGYEFQFSPSEFSLAELANWVVAEGKCCPFFDFHIDLEREGNLLCLRLTGKEGIKAFIRTEFQVPGKS
ncbi:MAG: hypothetical protein WBL63_18580 [Candidatus Acidiferrum sp.]